MRLASRASSRSRADGLPQGFTAGVVFVEVPKGDSAARRIAFVCPVAIIAHLRADGRSQVGVRAQLLSRGPLAAPTTQGGPPFFLIAAGSNAANFCVIAKAQ